jgi:WD40 repeat protein
MAHPEGKYLQFAIILFILPSLLGACGSAQAPSGSDLAALTPSPAASSTITPIPSLTPTPTFTRAPTRTPLPTYIHITPVFQGTLLPQSGPAISLDNASRLTLLARWGLGNPGDILYTPDGQYLIIACATGVYFFDPADHSLIKQLDTPYLALHLAVSPDSQLFAVAAPGQVYVYRIADFDLLHTFSVQANSLSFSPDGEVLALGISLHPTSYIQFRSLLSGEILGIIEDTLRIWDVEYSPQGDYIASAGYGARVWTLGGTLTAEVGPHHSGLSVPSISFSPDGSLLAVGTNYEIHLWSLLENGRLTHYREIDLTSFNYADVLVVAISPDDRLVAAALDNGIYAWDIESGSIVFEAPESANIYYRSLAWSVDSQHITAASVESGVQIWDLQSGAILASPNTNTGSFTSLAWSPNGQLLAAGASEGWAYIFEWQNGAILQRVGDGYHLNSLAYSPDSQVLAVGSSDNRVQFWTMEGALIRTLDGFGYGSTDVAYSTAGEFFGASSSDNWGVERVRLWSTADWNVAHTFSLGNNDYYRVTSFIFTPDGQSVAIVYQDRTGISNQTVIQITTIATGEVVATLETRPAYLTAAAFSSSGDMLAVLTSNYFREYDHVQVWRTSDWRLLYTTSIIPERIPRGDIILSSSPHPISWSQDSNVLAVGVNDGSIQLLRARDGEILATLPGHRMWAASVAFSPDGRILASCSLDGTIMLWGTR